jgi:hypothetical protein
VIRAASKLALALAAIACLAATVGTSAANSGLPPGWHAIERPITSVVDPRQVLAAATYPIVFRHPPESCQPRAAVSQMPPTGVLLQIIEYLPLRSGRPLRLPPRPHRFSYEDAIYALFECAGRSFQFAYEQGGHALQAQIWMKLATVDPHWRAEALRILNHFRP